MKRRIHHGAFVLAILLLLQDLPAQEPAAALATGSDAAAKAAAVTRIGEILAESYVFPVKGAELQRRLQKQLKAGTYDKIADPRQLAAVLTGELQDISGDRHLRVIFDPEQVRRQRARENLDEETRRRERERLLERERERNFGFRRLEILSGNVGLLELTGFSGSREAGPTIVAAMNFLANADAVIFDLRGNGGGSPLTIQIICSYLLDDVRHLNSFEWRGEEGQRQFWSLPWVPGASLADVDVYILTSGRTFSAAEEFTYDLKSLKRATLVGEKTGGGAHPGGTRIVDDGFLVWVPSGRAINPVTKTNWEGTGIEPDVAVPVAQALDKAHALALEKIAARAKDPEKAAAVKWAREDLIARTEPAAVPVEILRRYTGNYGIAELALADGRLVARVEGRDAPLVPLSETYFWVGEPSSRVEFVPAASGKGFDLILHMPGGRRQHVKRVSD